MKKRPLILVCNDDGIRADGIKKLATALRRVGDVYVVAPDRERSAASHSLTLHRPLRIDKIGEKEYAVDGTPTDCISLAINSILHRKPDLVFSGINRGGNLGEDVTYSGTVSAAMEGTLLGSPSVAVSLVPPKAKRNKGDLDYSRAAAFSATLARKVLAKGLPADTLLNVNVPSVKNTKGVRITTQGTRTFGDVVFEKEDPRGKTYYWIGGDLIKWDERKETDFYSVGKGYISITPIHMDLTNYSSIENLKKWKF